MGRSTNRMITFNDAQYMVTNEGFTQAQAIPASNKCMTRANIEAYLANVNTSNFSTYGTTQLVPYNKILPLSATYAWRPINPYCLQEGVNWVAGGSGGGFNIITSDDGITWTGRTIGDGSSVFKVRYLNNIWFAMGATITMKSADGINWTSFTTAGVNARDIGFNGTTYVVVGNGTYKFASSTNLTSWTNRGSSGNFDEIPNSVMYLNSTWYVGNSPDLSSYGALFTSPDAITFTINNTDLLDYATDFVTNGSKVFAVGGGQSQYAEQAISPPTTWVDRANTVGPATYLSAITRFNGLYVVGGDGGGSFEIATSPDMKVGTFTARNSAGIGNVDDFASDGVTLFAVGLGTTNMVKSTDAITWTSVSNPLTTITSITRKT